MSSRLWNRLNEAATVAQLSGLDSVALISMVVQLSLTVRSNKEEYRQLAQRVLMLHGLMELLPAGAETTQHRAIRDVVVVAGLKDTLWKAYMLLRSFRDRGATYRLFMGWRQADQLREVHKEIDRYLLLYPVVSHIATDRLLHLITDRIEDTSGRAAAIAAAAACAHVHTLAEDSDGNESIVGVASPPPAPPLTPADPPSAVRASIPNT